MKTQIQIITKRSSGWATAALALALALLQGCATGPNANPADPLEPLNRATFSFNDGLDRAVVKPVATVYKEITPSPVRTGVTNFFGNISDVWSVVNNLLQFKPEQAGDSLARVALNTSFGLGGLLDFATEAKIRKHTADFGQTLGVWGLASGPYLVLPVLGPSSVRDTAGLLVDSQGDLVTQGIHDVPVRNSLIGLRAVNRRANLLDVGDLLEQAALDKYSFAREAYLQHRRSLVGGAAAEPEAPEERFDLPEVAPRSDAPAAPAPAAK
jgi:phospholipid-binding lipoprotein MlaA